MIILYIMESLQLQLNEKIIKNNEIIPFDQSQTVPKILLSGLSNNYYTIIAVDPDAPSRFNPIYKYVLHLLIINNNQTIASYHLPSPPPGSGNHRYIFYLLKQTQKIDKNKIRLNIVNGKLDRRNFNLGNFMVNFGLEIVDSVCFETSR